MAVLWITLLIVIFDQLTKLLIKGSPWSFLPFKGMPYGSSMPFIDDIVRITYIENPGIAFGITIPGFKVFFAVFSIVASIAILLYLKRNVHRLRVGERIALALILGGAIGNLIDRVFYGVFYGYDKIFYGKVVDFVDFGYKRNWFPVFNVADSAVSVGVVLLILLIMRHKPAVVGPEAATFQDPNLKHEVSFTDQPLNTPEEEATLREKNAEASSTSSSGATTFTSEDRDDRA